MPLRRTMLRFSFGAYGLILLVWLLSSTAWGQLAKPYTLQTEASGLVSGAEQSPFWLRANQYGLIPLEAPAGLVRAGLSVDFATPLPDSIQRNRRKLDWGLGVEGALVSGTQQKFVLPEAYLKLRYGNIELWGGRRREFIGITDTTLTSGSIAWSNNALPIPKIQIGTAGFIPLKFLRNFVALRGTLAHGWFNVPYIQGAYLHYKSLHGRFGKPSGRVAVYVGINHMVQWGGHADYLRSSPFAVNGHLTTNPGDFIRGILLGQLSSERNNDRFTGFDGENRVGNHLGNYDFAVSIKGNGQSFLWYHQHLFEDLSGLLFLNGFDGLHGFSWSLPTSSRRVKLNKLLFEYLTTTNQAGSTFDITARFQGGDNYFNHSQYIQGWSYYDRAIGTPLLPVRSELLNGTLTNVQFFFPNNRVNAFHLAGQGSLFEKLNFQARLTYSLNRGTFSLPFPRTLPQFSSLLALSTHPDWLKGFSVATRIAYDAGDLYPSTFGAFLSVSKTWSGIKQGK